MGVSFDTIIDRIGHDGSAIAWPAQPEPLCRRAFHIQEILYAAHQLGFSVMPVQLNPTITNGYGPSTAIEDKFFERAKTMKGVHLGTTDNGINHAVAHYPAVGFWCPNRGFISSFNTREVWLVNKCS
jgi:hypothetical protein